jgi:hypothetical protein
MSDAPSPEQPQPLMKPSAATAAVVLALLLVVNVPLFLCMPLTDDTTLYDLQAINLMDGGVMYRDIFEPNLPGVVWVHVAVRSLVGSGSIAMRVADLTFFSIVVWLLCRWLRAIKRSTPTQLWLAVVLFLFYFSVSEWCHCQRDMWMLVPGLAALHLRRRQLVRQQEASTTSRSVTGWGVLEGLLWGVGVWIKPLIMVPALACWIVSALQIRNRRVWFDLAGLLMGGIAIGAAGMLWMVLSGAWPSFYETWTQWNPRYLESRGEHWTTLRFLGMTYRLTPWIFVHLVAVPVSLAVFASNLRRKPSDSPADDTAVVRTQSLLAAVYLGWMIQSFFLQHLFDYVHVPSLLLAIAILAAAPRWLADRRGWQYATIGFLGVAVIASPLLHSDRLTCWPVCLNEGSTPAIQNRLSHFDHPNWEDLHSVADYLQDQGIRDGELTCFNNNLISLYRALDVRPSSRYVYVETLAVFFPDRRDMIFKTLDGTNQRFLVTDLSRIGLPPERLNEIIPGKPLPANFPKQLKRQPPFASPIVFRAGDIVVHRVEPPNSPSTLGPDDEPQAPLATIHLNSASPAISVTPSPDGALAKAVSPTSGDLPPIAPGDTVSAGHADATTK